ncbi:MAG: hypothetical protein IKG92_08430 [Bacteroidales bacterium]|nr:hypothetical protein [Bacteroidales bacterium]
MSGKADLLNSNYIIDGVQMALTPQKMLRECMVEPPLEPDGDAPTLADEREDPAPDNYSYDESLIERYAQLIQYLEKRELPIPFAGSYSAGKVAQALLDAIWMNGHFRLGDLSLKAEWKWNDKEIGLPAAFYNSVEEACSYIDALGVKIEKYSVTGGVPSVAFKASTVAEVDDDEITEEESLLRDLPYRTVNPRMSRRRKVAASLVPEPSDWLLYIPFDPCDFRLGGSALSQALHTTPSTAPDIQDADYFIDCYEVVRELVEDGVVKAGATVGEGGLMMALRSLATANGADVCIRDICKAYGDEKPVRVLFGEVPGVVIQIADIDYDYVDAELILQDVVYFPIGHPVPGKPGVQLSDKVEIPQILESLLNTLEGED